LAISLSQRAISKGFNPESAEYYAGHTVDSLGYRQLHDIDASYRLEQYKIVEPYLDASRNGVPPEIRRSMERQSVDLQTLQDENKILKDRLKKLEQMVGVALQGLARKRTKRTK
jgi:hypothetical protein